MQTSAYDIGILDGLLSELRNSYYEHICADDQQIAALEGALDDLNHLHRKSNEASQSKVEELAITIHACIKEHTGAWEDHLHYNDDTGETEGDEHPDMRDGKHRWRLVITDGSAIDTMKIAKAILCIPETHIPAQP